MASVPREKQFASPYRHLLLAFRKPLSPDQSRSIAKLAVASDLVPVFFPRAYEPEPLRQLWDEDKSLEELLAQWTERWIGPRGKTINLTPCTDDKPFVIDLTFGVPEPLRRFLAGTAALCILLMACAVAAAPRAWAPTSAAWCIYFACLGVAFMLVEVMLIQIFTLYLGYPVLSLATVLFAILFGAGLGSLASQRVPVCSGTRAVAVAIAVLVLSAMALRFGGPAVFSATLGWDVRLRSLLTLLMIVPMGVAMGVPFPTGVRMAIDYQSDRVVPWMWAVNGVASVVGSASAMALAKVAGFGSAFAVGLGAYLLALAMLLLAATRTGPRTTRLM
jgi:hypothetical protein